MTTVSTIDFQAEFDAITERLKRDQDRRFQQPEVALYDGDWTYRGTVYLEKGAKFTLTQNETGVGVIEMPASYYLAKWLVAEHARSTKNVNVVVEKDGIRWDGMLDEVEREKTSDGVRIVRATFKHSYEHVKHILCYSNPFLPPEVQFPRVWILFGPAIWALKTTLFFNILRLESALWAIPDDPMDVSQWFDLDQSNWSMVVAPTAFGEDSSQFAIVHSRFKMFHDVAKNVMKDAQLTLTTRRYLDGDPPPWPGADLQHGCLVIDIVDKSGWDTETSFGGNLFTGLVRAFTSIVDGYNQGEETIPDPAFPPEYSTPGFKGTVKTAPGVIVRDGQESAIGSSSFKYKPPTSVGAVTGGHSMPGVNELISAGIQMAGDLTAMMIGVPPIGGAVDAVLSPLYTDTLLAFMKHKDIFRANQLSTKGFYLHEDFAQGADRAYTLSALLALRTQHFLTDKKTSHTVKIHDGIGELRIGAVGYGNAELGDKIGTTVDDGGSPGIVYVDRISELTLAWDRDTAPTWDVTVGSREASDPVIDAYERIQEVMALAAELGVA